MSMSQNWRDDLKKGDLVDALDTKDTWSTGTVIWIDQRTDDKKMAMAKIGWR